MPKVHSGAAATAAALFLCALLTTVARDAGAAAQFSLEPLRLSLPAHKLATALTLGNEGSSPVTVQVELVSWKQDGRGDVFGEPGGLIASPPVFSIAPGARQILRVGRPKREVAPAREVAYRVLIHEVPPKDSDRPPVATVMSISVPLFVPPAKKNAKPALAVTGVAQDGADLRIDLANAGLVHDKVVRLMLVQDGKTLAERPLNAYVLAEASRVIPWPGAARLAHPGLAQLTLELGHRRTLTHAVTLVAPMPAAPPPAPTQN